KNAFAPVAAPRAVITLMHGTFALNSTWTRPGSSFVTNLSSALAVRGFGAVQFRRFLWSGGNTFSARATAQREFGADLDDVARTFPGVPHFVVALSHGGTVALVTALARDNGFPIAGLACLATPFLVGRTRNIRVM